MPAEKPIAVLNPDDIPVEIMADSIRRISAGFARLTSTGLTTHAIAVLLKDQTGVAMATTKLILAALPKLASIYTVPKSVKKSRRG